MKSDRVVTLVNEAERHINSIFIAALSVGHTQSAIVDRYIMMKGELEEKKLPKKHMQYVSGYFRAFLHSYAKTNVVFRYCVDGEYYSVRKEDTKFPKWDTLPRDMWDKLGDLGGLYYKESNKLFFKEGA